MALQMFYVDDDDGDDSAMKMKPKINEEKSGMQKEIQIKMQTVPKNRRVT